MLYPFQKSIEKSIAYYCGKNSSPKRMMWEDCKGQRQWISAMKEYVPVMVGLNSPQLYHILKT